MIHQSSIAATMAGVTGTASHINHLLWLAEAAQNQFPLRNIPLNLPQRTSRFDSSMAPLCKRRQCKDSMYAIFKLQVYGLVVRHIVVAVENAPPIWPGTQRIVEGLDRKSVV